jgi:antibiotic biosynthesis monooxygenase (ABM) superfamily enzyme
MATNLPNKPQAHSGPDDDRSHDQHQHHQHQHRRPSHPSSFTNSFNSNTVLTEITEDEKDNESIMFAVAEPAFSPAIPPPATPAPRSSWKKHFRRQSLTANCPKDCQQPLTVFAKFAIQPGNERDFEQWYKDITKIQNDHWPGYLSSELLKPMAHSNDYIAIFRYDNYAHLEAWMMSTQRHEMLQRAKAFSKEPPLLSFHSLEYWFVPPPPTITSGGDDKPETMNNKNNDEENADPTEASTGDQPSPAAQPPAAPPRPPPKYKMVIVTALVIWAMNQWTGKVLVLIFGKGTLPKPLLQFLTTLLTVMSAFYVALPVATALVGFWLFPAQPYLTTVRNGFMSLPWPVPKLITSMESYYYTTIIAKRDAAADAKRKGEEQENNNSSDEDEAATERGGRSKVRKTEVEDGGGDDDDDEPKNGNSENQINAESHGDVV